jgi:alkanesulfonate monooxygenase SsuD/methylene tetrahydromethanopterin reductase-like flavin-dependent oxidoreductase (luciferase family)
MSQKSPNSISFFIVSITAFWIYIGVGPGSSKKDYDVCGIPYEDRWKRFDEALQILQMLWNTESNKPGLTNFNGIYYKIKNLSTEPQPV